MTADRIQELRELLGPHRALRRLHGTHEWCVACVALEALDGWEKAQQQAGMVGGLAMDEALDEENPDA